MLKKKRLKDQVLGFWVKSVYKNYEFAKFHSFDE